LAILASAVENSNLTMASRAMRFFSGPKKQWRRSQQELDLVDKAGVIDYFTSTSENVPTSTTD
jgi:hypothetical protein